MTAAVLVVGLLVVALLAATRPRTVTAVLAPSEPPPPASPHEPVSPPAGEFTFLHNGDHGYVFVPSHRQHRLVSVRNELAARGWAVEVESPWFDWHQDGPAPVGYRLYVRRCA
ncbi:MAG: hypothetical protein ACRDYU_03790 [Actinomycetes bacterium]